MYSRKDLVGIKDLSKEEILHFLDVAIEMKKKIKNNSLRTEEYKNYSAMTLFYENSTRTKMSFLLACEYLGVKVVDLNVATSSKSKGESLLDTALNIDEMGTDLVIMRNTLTGSPHFLSENIKAGIINAGDGSNEHPTQCLLDLMTIRENKNFENLNVLIAGDINHSRVAKSNIYALQKLGANVTLVGPTTYLSKEFEKLGVTVSHNLEKSIKDKDVVMTLRVQLERQKQNNIPSLGEYNKFFGINKDILKLAKKDVILMHPGPINRGVELSSDVIDNENSVILNQVENGVAVRMAIIKTLLDNRK